MIIHPRDRFSKLGYSTARMAPALKGRRWKDLADSFPKTCRLVLEPRLVRSNRALRVGSGGVLPFVTFGMLVCPVYLDGEFNFEGRIRRGGEAVAPLRALQGQPVVHAKLLSEASIDRATQGATKLHKAVQLQARQHIFSSSFPPLELLSLWRLRRLPSPQRARSTHREAPVVASTRTNGARQARTAAATDRISLWLPPQAVPSSG